MANSAKITSNEWYVNHDISIELDLPNGNPFVSIT